MSKETRDELQTRRQSFFESDSIDQLVTMVPELAAEQWVLRERLFTVEKAADQLGLKLSAAVESYQFSDEDKAQLAQMRKAAIENLMRSVNREHRRLPPFGAA